MSILTQMIKTCNKPVNLNQQITNRLTTNSATGWTITTPFVWDGTGWISTDYGTGSITSNFSLTLSQNAFYFGAKLKSWIKTYTGIYLQLLNTSNVVIAQTSYNTGSSTYLQIYWDISVYAGQTVKFKFIDGRSGVYGILGIGSIGIYDSVKVRIQ